MTSLRERAEALAAGLVERREKTWQAYLDANGSGAMEALLQGRFEEADRSAKAVRALLAVSPESADEGRGSEHMPSEPVECARPDTCVSCSYCLGCGKDWPCSPARPAESAPSAAVSTDSEAGGDRDLYVAVEPLSPASVRSPGAPSGDERRFRKRPVVVEAMQMPTKPDQSKVRLVAEWMADGGYREHGYPDVTQVDEMHQYGEIVLAEYGSNFLTIATLEGDMTASPGDWIIKGVQGEFYPCKPDIFEATYEPASRPSLEPVSDDGLAAAWDEGYEAFAAQFLQPVDDAGQRPKALNPYLAALAAPAGDGEDRG